MAVRRRPTKARANEPERRRPRPNPTDDANGQSQAQSQTQAQAQAQAQPHLNAQQTRLGQQPHAQPPPLLQRPRRLAQQLRHLPPRIAFTARPPTPPMDDDYDEHLHQHQHLLRRSVDRPALWPARGRSSQRPRTLNAANRPAHAPSSSSPDCNEDGCPEDEMGLQDELQAQAQQYELQLVLQEQWETPTVQLMRGSSPTLAVDEQAILRPEDMFELDDDVAIMEQDTTVAQHLAAETSGTALDRMLAGASSMPAVIVMPMTFDGDSNWADTMPDNLVVTGNSGETLRVMSGSSDPESEPTGLGVLAEFELLDNSFAMANTSLIENSMENVLSALLGPAADMHSSTSAAAAGHLLSSSIDFNVDSLFGTAGLCTSAKDAAALDRVEPVAVVLNHAFCHNAAALPLLSTTADKQAACRPRSPVVAEDLDSSVARKRHCSTHARDTSQVSNDDAGLQVQASNETDCFPLLPLPEVGLLLAGLDNAWLEQLEPQHEQEPLDKATTSMEDDGSGVGMLGSAWSRVSTGVTPDNQQNGTTLAQSSGNNNNNNNNKSSSSSTCIHESPAGAPGKHAPIQAIDDSIAATHLLDITDLLNSLDGYVGLNDSAAEDVTTDRPPHATSEQHFASPATTASPASAKPRKPKSPARRERNRVAAVRCRERHRSEMQAMAASEQQLLESSQQLQQEMKRLMQQALALEHTLLHHQCTNARGGLTPREVEQLSIDLRAVHAGTYVEPQDLGDSNAAPAASRESAPPRSSAVAALRSSILHKRRSAAQPSPPAGPESEVGHVSSRNAAIPQPPPQPKRLSAKLSKKQQIGG